MMNTTGKPGRETGSPIPFSESRIDTTAALDLPLGLRVREYRNANEHVYYEETGFHTFSMYLAGGYETRRTDEPADSGAPGLFCLMPAGSYSAWDIGTPQRFMHVYFSDDYIKQLALRHLDIDPRRIQLPQLTFKKNQSLEALITHGVANRAWSDPDNKMILQHNLKGVLLNLLQTVGIAGKSQYRQYKGGLSPVAQRRVKEYIDAHYARRIDLSELASQAGLSEFHFARMFKISFACTPQQYINDLRIGHIKDYLTQSESPREQSLAALALSHGFSSQSHMGRVFKQVTGTTPAKFSKAAH